MTNITPFNYADHEVRTVTIDGEPWFVAADICDVLEIGNPTQALTRLDNDEHALISNEGRQYNVVTESGMYALVLGSRKSEARTFRRWITSEVIPAIRKHGGYISPNATPEQLDGLKRQAEVLKLMQGVIDPAHLEAKARIVLARAMGETPEVAPLDRPLYAEGFLKEKGRSSKWVKSNRGQFGKYIKAAYMLEHGEEPKRCVESVDGRSIEISAYAEKHRPLFEKVWQTKYA